MLNEDYGIGETAAGAVAHVERDGREVVTVDQSFKTMDMPFHDLCPREFFFVFSFLFFSFFFSSLELGTDESLIGILKFLSVGPRAAENSTALSSSFGDGYKFLFRGQYTEVDEADRLPGIFPGHLVPIVVQEDGYRWRGTVTAGRRVLDLENDIVIEVMADWHGSEAGEGAEVLRVCGLLSIPNYLVAPEHEGKDLLPPVLRDVQDLRIARDLLTRRVTLVFPAEHYSRIVRIADHDNGVEDPVSREIMWESMRDDEQVLARL